MKTFKISIIGMLCAISAYCQDEEFKVYSNGLIYSEQTMKNLGYIVDSLNLKFKICNFNTVFFSKSQTFGNIVKVDASDIKQAKKDMANQISFENFIKNYPKSIIDQNVLIIKDKYKDYENKDIAEFQHFDLTSNDGFTIYSKDVTLYQKDFTNKWLYEYHPKTEYSDETLTAFYFPTNFSSAPIPQKYAQMIGYSDCLIDTTTSKFKDDSKEGWVDLPKNWILLSIKEKVRLLEEMRSTSVIGRCSMDTRPREQAVYMALLSADTYNWEIFLKSHLDIMNDRFQRVSDGSYAWEQRNTYIKELEELNINVPDLMFGISFRIENPAKNHYFGSIGRLGRALSESKNRNEIEQVMISIISDNELDIYNRLLFYFLYRNYTHFTNDEKIKNENIEKLTIAKETFPDFISVRLKVK
jgi:hypothetical protein